MTTLEAIEQAAILDINNPLSPHYPKARLELENAALRKEYNQAVTDRVTIALVTEKVLEDKALTQQQLANRAATEKKYLQDITTQQEEAERKKVQQALEQTAPANQTRFVSTQDVKFTQEIMVLREQLKTLEETHTKLKEEWTASQDRAVAAFDAKLRESKIQIESKSGIKSSPSEAQIKIISEAIRQPDIDKIMQVNPHFGREPAQKAVHIEHACLLGGPLAQLKAIHAMDNPEGIKEEIEFDPKAALAAMKRNRAMLDLVHKQKGNNYEATVRQAIQLVDNRNDRNKVESQIKAKENVQKENKQSENKLHLQSEEQQRHSTTPTLRRK